MENPTKIHIRNLSFAYNGKPVLDHTSIDFTENRITAIVGPSGSGKSTFLKTLNRLWEADTGGAMQGTVEIRFADQFQDIYHPSYPVTRLRRQVGMVFQTPNPLPMSIFKNVAFPLKLRGKTDRKTLPTLVEASLKMVGLWDEVRDRLDTSALELSGGQQQRLCIARAMILQPEVLLLDEPTASLDHRAAENIEQLLLKLKKKCTILVVSHYLDQVRRIADAIVTLSKGKLEAQRPLSGQ
jgi:phosphate transport system ATP-binding protein